MAPHCAEAGAPLKQEDRTAHCQAEVWRGVAAAGFRRSLAIDGWRGAALGRTQLECGAHMNSVWGLGENPQGWGLEGEIWEATQSRG